MYIKQQTLCINFDSTSFKHVNILNTRFHFSSRQPTYANVMICH